MLRVIPFKQRALGIGVNWAFLRLFGFIPGGILFGLMIDTTCLKWQQSACGKKQSCLVYDPYKLSWTIMAVGKNYISFLKIELAVVCKLVSILATIIGYMTYKPNDLDSGCSVQTSDSRGPLSLTVNDDRKITTHKISTKTTSFDDNHVAKSPFQNSGSLVEPPPQPTLLRGNGTRSEPRPRSIIVID